MSGGLQTNIAYIALRLSALLGILLLLERTGSYVFHLQQPYSGSLVSSHHAINDTYRKSQSKNESALPVAPSESKVIVAASLANDNITWIDKYFPDWEANIYGMQRLKSKPDCASTIANKSMHPVMNDPHANMTVARNKGNEAAAYLTYLITHYHNLPDYMVFIHAQRYQWHNEDMMYDHVPVLQNLRLSHIAKEGYTSLRCTWNPGCPVGLRPDPQNDDGIFAIRAAYTGAFADLFPGSPIPREVGHLCCAQFAVSKNKVLEKPVTHYERVRQWLWETDLPAARSGRIIEYMWHMIFGKAAVYCPRAAECFCDKFGLCNLTCTEGECLNRYKLPIWGQKMPANWPDEKQGEDGWPVDGWWKDGN